MSFKKQKLNKLEDMKYYMGIVTEKELSNNKRSQIYDEKMNALN